MLACKKQWLGMKVTFLCKTSLLKNITSRNWHEKYRLSLPAITKPQTCNMYTIVLQPLCSSLLYDYELIFVDNASTDNSAALYHQLTAPRMTHEYMCYLLQETLAIAGRAFSLACTMPQVMPSFYLMAICKSHQKSYRNLLTAGKLAMTSSMAFARNAKSLFTFAYAILSFIAFSKCSHIWICRLMLVILDS